MVSKESAQYEGTLRTEATIRSIPWAIILAFLVGIFTFLVRAIYLGRSFDIFIDEVTYLQIGRAMGFRQKLELAGQPFFLHPPAWFIIEGAYIRLFNITGNVIAQIYPRVSWWWLWPR